MPILLRVAAPSNMDLDMALADHHQSGIRREKKGSSVSVVIPCFNEQDNIEPLYQALSRIGLGIDSEIIIVNDGSGDETVGKIQLIRRFEG